MIVPIDFIKMIMYECSILTNLICEYLCELCNAYRSHEYTYNKLSVIIFIQIPSHVFDFQLFNDCSIGCKQYTAACSVQVQSEKKKQN